MAEKKSKELNLVSGAVFHDFKENPIFTGQFLRPVFKQDSPEEQIGNLFVNEDGEECILPANFAIEQALDMVPEGFQETVREMEDVSLKVAFLGTIKKKDGQDFNRFKIDLIVND